MDIRIDFVDSDLLPIESKNTLLICWLCFQISMSDQQENTTVAMWPSATTPLVHITALVRKDMSETSKTAPVRRRSGCLLFFTFTRNCISSFYNNSQIYPIFIGWPNSRNWMHFQIKCVNAKCFLKSKHLRYFQVTVDPAFYR